MTVRYWSLIRSYIVKEQRDKKEEDKGFEQVNLRLRQEHNTMTTYRLFEGKDHAFIYHKYRIPPPDEVKNIILQYLDKKVCCCWLQKLHAVDLLHCCPSPQKGRPHVLAVDLGCGTGQLSRVLAPHFKEVVGIDVSESQLEQARVVPGYPNITYR